MINNDDVSSTAQRTQESKVWLVTGCSSGLGKCLVSAILARGDKVIATARQLSAMKEFEGHDDIKTLSLDVASSQDVLDTKVKEAVSFFGRIDILVNNAGYVESGVWEELRYVSHTSRNNFHFSCHKLSAMKTLLEGSRPTSLGP